MNDFDYDIVQKKRTARCAFAHVNRKRGKCRLPSDYLTAAQRKELNGEMKTYNITKPMPWAEFVKMPDDLKREYFRNMQSYGAAATYLAQEMGVCGATIRENAEKLGAPFVRGIRAPGLWNKKLAEWSADNAPEEEAVQESAEQLPPPQSGAELLHARLTVRGDRESILANLRLLIPDVCEMTVEW